MLFSLTLGMNAKRKRDICAECSNPDCFNAGTSCDEANTAKHASHMQRKTGVGIQLNLTLCESMWVPPYVKACGCQGALVKSLLRPLLRRVCVEWFLMEESYYVTLIREVLRL